MWGWVLVRVVAFLASEVVLSPVVPLHVGMGVGSCGSLPALSSRLVSRCLPSCGMGVVLGVVAFLASRVVLSSVVSGCLPSCGGGCWLVW